MERRSKTSFLTSRAGFSLVEVVIAILLTAVIVMATFSALLVTKADLGRSDTQMMIGVAQRQLLETLNSYQSASIMGADVNSGPNVAARTATPPGSTWSLPQDTGLECHGQTNCPVQCDNTTNTTLTGCSIALDSCGANQYALLPCCVHNVTQMLPPAITAANGVMCYTVIDGSGLSQTNSISPANQQQFKPQVQVYVQWTQK